MKRMTRVKIQALLGALNGLFVNRIGKIGVCLTICLTLPFGTAQNVPVTVADPLGRAFQATGAELAKAYVTGRAELTAEEYEPDKAVKILKVIAARMDISLPAAAIERQDSDYQECFKLSFSDESRQTVISLIRRREGQNGASVIIHNIQKYPQYQDIAAVKNNIYEILQIFNSSPLITTCLEGYLDGKLRKGEWEFCLKDSFAAVGARRISGLDNGTYMSHIGYSALLPEKITAGGEDVNFNVAMRYHSFDNRTYVTIGSPLIAVDY